MASHLETGGPAEGSCLMFSLQATPRGHAAPAGGGNIGKMLTAQSAIYWHADLQAVLVGVFVFLFVIHTELSMNGNIHSAQFDCRVGVITALCTDYPLLYPFLHWRNGMNAVRVLMLVTTLATMLSIVYYHYHHLELKRAKGRVAQSTPLYRWRELRKLLFELFLVSIFPYPWVEELTSNSNSYLFLFIGSSFRFYLPLRSLFFHSALNSNSARFIAALSGITFNPVFVFRAYLYLYPVYTTTSLTVSMYVISAYLLRVFENMGCLTVKADHCAAITLADSMWMVAITILSIGYNSTFVPASSSGKILMGIVGTVGVCLVLVNVALALISLKLTDVEECVLHTWDRLKNKAEEKVVAVRTLQRIFLFHKGYFHSLKWTAGAFGITYREVSKRVPCERAAVQSVLDFYETRLRLKRKSLDEDYSIVKRIMASKALLDVSKLIDCLKPFSKNVCGPRNTALTILESPNFFALRAKAKSPKQRKSWKTLVADDPSAPKTPTAAELAPALEFKHELDGGGAAETKEGAAPPAPEDFVYALDPLEPGGVLSPQQQAAAAVASEWARVVTAQLNQTLANIAQSHSAPPK